MSKAQFLPASADALARLHTAEALGVMVEAMRGDIEGIKPSERLKAAQVILERGHGKAVQAVIQVPAKARLQAQLAELSDEQLLELARGGSGGRKEGPQGTGSSDGTMQAEAEGLSPGVSSGITVASRMREQTAMVPRAKSRWHAEAIDAEIEEDYDPTA
jgi:hypothetical protein